MSGLSGDRWVCTRCFTSNGPELEACPNCGQRKVSADQNHDTGVSDSTPPPAEPEAPPDQPEWMGTPMPTPPTPPTAEWTAPAAATLTAPPVPAGRSRLMWASIATCLIGAALVGFGFLSAAQRSDTGAINHAGPMAWNDLQAGDCFNFRDEGDTVDQVDAVLCADPHVYEVFWVGAAPDGEFPTTDEVDTFAQDTCSPAFEDYVGHEIETSVWYASYVAPGEDAWNAGEHTIVCHLFNSTETPVEGSAAGSAQ